MRETSWEVVREADLDASVIAAWDELAVTRGRPYCAPAWMLSWGTEPEGRSHLRIGLVRERERVIGIIPLIGRPLPPGGGARYELLSSGTSYRIEPLAAPGKQEQVAAAGGELLGSLEPRVGVLSLHGIDPEAGWSEALAAVFPGKGARLVRRAALHAPILSFDDAADYEAWLRTKTRHFRKRALSDKRRFLRTGELKIASTPAEMTRAIEAFVKLHLGRWRGRRRRSHLDHPSMPARLIAASERLGPTRLRASTAVVGDQLVAVDIFVLAGGVAAAWNGGWLESYAALRPGWLSLLSGIEDAIALGIAEVDLGPGAHPWKQRLATRDATVVSDRLLPRLPRSAATYAYLVPEQLREAARRRRR